MEVWINKSLNGDTMAWRATAGRTLEVFNNTGRIGRRFKHIWLGYKRDGRKHVISLNINKKKRQPTEKVVGIWVADCNYTVIQAGEVFTGKTLDRQIIIGRFGIYNVGTILNCQGVYWKLTKDRGWVIDYDRV